MSVEPPLDPDLDDLPEPVIRPRNSNLSVIWLVPLVAVLIGGWLIYKALTERGPEVTISFKTAEGLEPGKTKIKFKDVEIGLVLKIDLSEDLSRVLVRAQLDKSAERYLSPGTRFWVVRARVAASRVSGLETVFTGAYIALEPGAPGEPILDFTGIEEPPVVTSGAPGRLFILHADRRGSLEIGSPVYFRQIQVGEVVAYHLDDDGSRITFQIFVHAPYHDFVRRNTRFWNASGFDVKLDAKGVSLDTESLVSILVGGIAFDALDPLDHPVDPAAEKETFILFANRELAHERLFATKSRYELHFTTSVRGLTPGAPVEFRGIPLGRVVDIALEFDIQAMAFTIPVVVELEPERVAVTGRVPEGLESRDVIKYLVGKGLRAQLRTASLLTGQQFVALDLFPATPAPKTNRAGKHPQIPTIPPPLEEITSRLSNLVAKFDRLPLDQIGSDLRDTVQGTKRLANSPAWLDAVGALEKAIQETGLLAADLRARTVPEMGTALAQVERTLSAAGSALAAEAPLQTRARNALAEIERAARSLRSLTDYLEQHPESLIMGKGGEK